MHATRDTPEPPSIDFTLESTAGVARTLSSYRGTPVVVVYEPRDRIEDNRRLKDALDALAADGRIAVLAVGDLRPFDLPGARPVARAAVCAIAAHKRVEILFDWKGVLTRPPFDLDASRSNVLVFDRQGAIAFRHTGVLAPGELARCLAVLG